MFVQLVLKNTFQKMSLACGSQACKHLGPQGQYWLHFSDAII